MLAIGSIWPRKRSLYIPSPVVSAADSQEVAFQELTPRNATNKSLIFINKIKHDVAHRTPIARGSFSGTVVSRWAE